MAGKALGIILGGCIGGVIVISVVMLAGSGWETPGQYTGNSNAAHTVSDPNNCQPFQTGCTNTNYETPNIAGGPTSTLPPSSSGSASSSSSGSSGSGYSP